MSQQNIYENSQTHDIVQKGDKTKQISLSQIIARSFSLKDLTQNKIIFMSKSISLAPSLAISFLRQIPQKNKLFTQRIILIDFPGQQIDEIQCNLKSQMLKQNKKIFFQNDFLKKFEVVKLSNMTIEKRKNNYLLTGLYSISSQVFMTDLLRGWFFTDKKLRTKIFIKLSQKVRDLYHYLSWITTFLKIQEKQKQQDQQKQESVCIAYICQHPNHYSDLMELQRIYRTFFCKKVVIWPFGRAQIHKALTTYRQNSPFKQWQHVLSLSEGQSHIMSILMKFFNFLKKAYLKKHGENSMNPEQFLYGTEVTQEGFQPLRQEYIQFQNIKLLISQLENTNKLTMLMNIFKFVEENKCQIWSSNNSQIIQIVDELQTSLKEAILVYDKADSKTIQLKQLLIIPQNAYFTFNLEKQLDYSCQFKLQLWLKIRLEVNQKIKQLIKVVEDIKPTVKEDVKHQQLSQIERDIQIIQQRLTGPKSQKQQHNILVISSRRGIYQYIQKNLSGYLTNKAYLNYLLQLNEYLKFNRGLRLAKIKKIYERCKVKQGQSRANNTKDKKSWVEENKIILEQMLSRQLQKLSEIMLNYQLQINIINRQLQQAIESGLIYDINEEQISVRAKFHQNLRQANFIFVDITQIIAINDFQNLSKFVFETDKLRKNVVVDFKQQKELEIVHFYSIFETYKPQTIIFYSPNPSLIRSLYLYQIQNQSSCLSDIHILSFRDSYDFKRVTHQIIRQDKAFWNISQNRSQLHEFIESPYLRIREINWRDKVQESKHNLKNKSLFQVEESQNGKISNWTLNLVSSRRKILVDTRQFKSSLPSYLYHFGFQVIPVFLKTGDYILSDDIAVQKKSVQTRDLHNSLRNSRLQDQLKRMSSTFKKSYLLIECQEDGDCIKSNFGYLDGTSGNKSRYQLRKRLMQLLHKFPSIHLLWSSNVQQSCLYFKQLKTDKLDPDPSKFIKDQFDEINRESQQIKLPNISEASQKKQHQQKQN